MASSGSCIIWIDPDAGIFTLVSEEDYAWAVQWRWHTTPNESKSKLYATRVTEKREKGKPRKQRKVYLHKEILIRMGVKPRTKKHTIGDHRDGDSLNCQRYNLRWATPSMNSRNRRKRETPAPLPAAEEIPF